VAAGLVVVLVLAALGVGARVWQAGTLKSAVGVGDGLGDPRPAQADEAPARLMLPPPPTSFHGSATERTLARAADNAARELAGSGDGKMGVATGNPMYFNEAEPFINRVLSPALQMIRNGVLQQPCEALTGRCVTEGHAYDSSSYKGIFVEALADFMQATHQLTYAPRLVSQGEAVIRHAASNGRRATRCGSPHGCQLDFYWSRRIAPTRLPIQITPGSQEAGSAALTAAAAAARLG
jgi:hypothetical protein